LQVPLPLQFAGSPQKLSLSQSEQVQASWSVQLPLSTH
jgi:hypothetical protein